MVKETKAKKKKNSTEQFSKWLQPHGWQVCGSVANAVAAETNAAMLRVSRSHVKPRHQVVGVKETAAKEQRQRQGCSRDVAIPCGSGAVVRVRSAHTGVWW